MTSRQGLAWCSTLSSRVPREAALFTFISIYAAVDPVYMLMLIRRLGPEFIVWDKAAKIEFLKPGRETLQARFAVDEEELSAIRLASPEGATLGRPHLCSRIEGCLRNSVRSSRKDHLCPAP